jgi:hypothetical protein
LTATPKAGTLGCKYRACHHGQRVSSNHNQATFLDTVNKAVASH